MGACSSDGSAFHEPADRPCHWDLWWNNLLVTDDGKWFILDWDGLALGDPALDFATLSRPPAHEADWLTSTDVGFMERVRLYHRVQTLDWAIDVLADWIDCAKCPEHMEQVRAKKRADHEHYLRLYRETYARP